ncbi:MAG: DeoR family transcriptional regulator [Proteobacteria bacterium]|nr:DeoR family transcriptional regulator [Pseudomonadota bacterium]MBU1584408.1 DeoR family transcriptional regulator [Pseudomonadota bacterium]MBU2452410.1 DeoR family transcriptional regulator [Pseudomonadota bacterium]MBU2628150.1 DeoR family transcriptional regulator [Pseudomonadota bacterium]
MINKRKTINNRQEEIISLIKNNGFVTVEEMANLYNVTPQTIRRDINFLDKEGFVSRYHGGAGHSVSTENVAYRHRKEILLNEKKKIAQTVSAMIQDHSSLFINIGTTTELVASELMNHNKLRIITNNLNVAVIMSRKEDFEVIVTGGIVRSKDCGVTGEAAVKFIRQFKVDIGIIGISGIDLDGTLLDFDFREVYVARTIIENSRKVYLVTDHSKFGRNAMVKLGSITEIDTLITDKKPPKQLMDVISSNGINLVIS